MSTNLPEFNAGHISPLLSTAVCERPALKRETNSKKFSPPGGATCRTGDIDTKNVDFRIGNGRRSDIGDRSHRKHRRESMRHTASGSWLFLPQLAAQC